MATYVKKVIGIRPRYTWFRTQTKESVERACKVVSLLNWWPSVTKLTSVCDVREWGFCLGQLPYRRS